jgi:diguanylate cyclase (GGDEF)-like protein
MIRTNQVEQVGRLATQIQRRADLEVARSALRRRADDLAHEISTDALTGVGSRRWFDLEIDRLSHRTGWGAVLAIDIDHFKRINDNFGHHVGDLTLAAVGKILRGAVRANDPVARLGGEEFAVVLAGSRIAAAQVLGERIRVDIAQEPWRGIAEGLSVTTSVGVAAGPLTSIREVIRAADAALYDAKRGGRNRVVAA